MNRNPLSLNGDRAPLLCAALLGALFTFACGAENEREASPDAGGKEDSQSVQTDGQAGSDSTLMSDGDTLGSPGQMSSSPAEGPANTSPPITDPGGFVSVGTSDAGTFEIWCGSALCACSDGIDNDNDGVADGFDSECTGPFDDNEETFATGIPGDNRDPKWQDCFFDGNSGAGDDNCRYHTDCLTGDLPATDNSCQLTDACVEFCQPLTPPGCDCFGCCEVSDGEGTVNILLSETCSLDNLDDENACPRCEPTDTCANECGECELCLGKTLADLPSSCSQTPPGGDPDASVPPPDGNDGGTPPSTTDGPDTPPDGPVNVCDQGDPCLVNSECGSGDYCRLGCCAPIPRDIR